MLQDISSLLKNEPYFLYFIVAITSLVIGSFINVLIIRIPKILAHVWKKDCEEFLGSELSSQASKSLSLMKPSRCNNCENKIKFYDNIPIISYLILQGKCRNCGSKISLMYPIIELLTTVLSCIVVIKFGYSLQSFAFLILTWALITQAGIDYKNYILSDEITFILLWTGVLINLYAQMPPGLYIFGIIAGYMSLWSINLCYKLVKGHDGMGHGDFKLLAMLGAWATVMNVPKIIALSSVMGAAYGLILMLKNQKNSKIPFGPFLAISGWLVIMGIV